MTFNEVKSILLNQSKIVLYNSLTSDKVHSIYCTIDNEMIPNQSDSTKILVWNLMRKCISDIEVSSIISIEDHE